MDYVLSRLYQGSAPAMAETLLETAEVTETDARSVLNALAQHTPVLM